MSTKNLARTVIEGGRRHHNRWERRHSNAQERAHERLVSAALLTATDLDGAWYPERKVVDREFRDKLSPAERWLASQVGRPWAKVRSELFARFDTRTTAGRHILFDHLLKEVSDGGADSIRRADYAVDSHGTLRPNRMRRRYCWPRRAPLPEPASVLEQWLAARRVGRRGERYYWFVPTAFEAFRQASPLSEVEAARWRSLPAWFRSSFDALARPLVPHVK